METFGRFIDLVALEYWEEIGAIKDLVRFKGMLKNYVSHIWGVLDPPPPFVSDCQQLAYPPPPFVSDVSIWHLAK